MKIKLDYIESNYRISLKFNRKHGYKCYIDKYNINRNPISIQTAFENFFRMNYPEAILDGIGIADRISGLLSFEVHIHFAYNPHVISADKIAPDIMRILKDYLFIGDEPNPPPFIG